MKACNAFARFSRPRVHVPAVQALRASSQDLAVFAASPANVWTDEITWVAQCGRWLNFVQQRERSHERLGKAAQGTVARKGRSLGAKPRLAVLRESRHAQHDDVRTIRGGNSARELCSTCLGCDTEKRQMVQAAGKASPAAQ